MVSELMEHLELADKMELYSAHLEQVVRVELLVKVELLV